MDSENSRRKSRSKDSNFEKQAHKEMLSSIKLLAAATCYPIKAGINLYHLSNSVQQIAVAIASLISIGFVQNQEDSSEWTKTFAQLEESIKHATEIISICLPLTEDLSNIFSSITQGNVQELKSFLTKNNVNAPNEEGYTPLHVAALVGHVPIVVELVQNGADLESVNLVLEDGRTPLHLASIKRHFKVVQELLRLGANLRAKDSNGEEPFTIAAKLGNLELVELLMKSGVKVDDGDGKNALCYAVETQEVDMVKFLLKHGANACGVQSGTKKIDPPLIIAARTGNVQVIKELISAGAKPEQAVSTYGKSPLAAAAGSGHLEAVRFFATLGENKQEDLNTALNSAIYSGNADVVKELAKLGASVTEKQKNAAGYAPLYTAAEHETAEIVRVLVEMGADLEVVCLLGTPLHNAMHHENLETAKELLRLGANPNSRNRQKETPLFCTRGPDKIEMVRELVKHGADINATDEKHESVLHKTSNVEVIRELAKLGKLNIQGKADHSPLHRVAQKGSAEAVNELLKMGANIEAVNRKNETPIFLAIQGVRERSRSKKEGAEQAVEALIAAGANINARNSSGITPLKYAEECKLEKVVELLKKNGARA